MEEEGPVPGEVAAPGACALGLTLHHLERRLEPALKGGVEAHVPDYAMDMLVVRADLDECWCTAVDLQDSRAGELNGLRHRNDERITTHSAADPCPIQAASLRPIAAVVGLLDERLHPTAGIHPLTTVEADDPEAVEASIGAPSDRVL